MSTAVASPAVRSSRHVAFRVPAALLTLAMGVTGLHNLVTGWSDPLDGGVHRLQDLHWGVAEGLLLAVAMAWQLRRPAAHAGAMRVAALAALAQVVVMVAGMHPDPFSLVVALLVGVALWAHPARREVLRPPLAASRALVGVALPAALALLVFAGVQLSHHFAAAGGDIFEAKSGWAGAAISSVALAFVVLAAALVQSRSAVLLGAAGLAVLGVASLIHPHVASSFDVLGGAAALIVAVVLLAHGGARASQS